VVALSLVKVAPASGQPGRWVDLGTSSAGREAVPPRIALAGSMVVEVALDVRVVCAISVPAQSRTTSRGMSRRLPVRAP
jgi:hypothetical protein